MISDRVLFSRQDSVATITLNRPEARNALSPDMMADLGQALRSCRSGDVRAVLLKGAGGAFCSGGDVKDFTNKLEEGGPDAISQHLRDLAGTLHREVILEIRRLAKPVIAALAGVAGGGGLSLMLACDLVVAAEDAVFGVYCRRWGIPLMDGGTIRLTRLLGHSFALDLILTGRTLDARRARRIGLVDQVAPEAYVERQALGLLREALTDGEASVTGRRADLSEARAALEANLAVGRQPDWSVLLALLSTTLGDEVVLRTCRLGPVWGGPAGRAGADEAEELQIIQLELMGLALTQQAVTQVILRLEQTRLFRSVKLIDTRREPFMAGHAVAFRAECVLQTEPQIQEVPR